MYRKFEMPARPPRRALATPKGLMQPYFESLYDSQEGSTRRLERQFELATTVCALPMPEWRRQVAKADRQGLLRINSPKGAPQTPLKLAQVLAVLRSLRRPLKATPAWLDNG